jgi:ABC-type multidrug transport system ATPase subunit
VTQPLLTLRRFTLAFRQTTILSQLDLDVVAGTATVVVGPRGAGKTTLLRALAGIPFHGTIERSGSVAFAGQPIAPDHHLLLVAPTAVDWLGSLGDALSRDGVDAFAARLAVLQALGLVRLTCGLERPLLTLSALDARLALLARFAGSVAAGGTPPLLGLDEPTIRLTDAEIEEFCGVLRALAATTPLIVTTACETTARLLGGTLVRLRDEKEPPDFPADLPAWSDVDDAPPTR